MNEDSRSGDFDDDIDLSDDDDMDDSDDISLDDDDDDAEVDEDEDTDAIDAIAPRPGSSVGGMSARQRLEAYMENKRSIQDMRDVFDEFDDSDFD